MKCRLATCTNEIEIVRRWKSRETAIEHGALRPEVLVLLCESHAGLFGDLLSEDHVFQWPIDSEDAQRELVVDTLALGRSDRRL